MTNIKKDLNKIQTWAQGYFVDQRQYSSWTDEEKLKADFEEHFLVRPGPTANAICQAKDHELAAWIAERLNLASELEEKIKKMQTESI